MTTLAKQISELLFEHDCVIVPGIGGFITIYKPASINPNQHSFYPPCKQITFNSALNQNDGILINAFARSQNIDFGHAKNIIDDKIQTLRISLLRGKRVELENIGFLSTNKENNIEFEPSNTINYLGDAFGLTRFTFNPVDRSSGASRIISRPVVRKSMRWAAILLPVAAVAMWTTINPDSIYGIYNNYASIFNISTEGTPSLEKSKPINKTVAFPLDKISTATEDVTLLSKCVSPVSSDSYIVSQPEALSTNGITKTVVATVSHKSISKIGQVSSNNSNGQYYIIAGAFGVEENAAKLVKQLQSDGYKAELLGQNKRKLHLVSIQSYNDKEVAMRELQSVQLKGYPAAWLLEKTN